MSSTYEQLEGHPRTEADAVAEISAPATYEIDGHRFALAHEKLKLTSLGHFAAKPPRLSGTTAAGDLDSFIGLVNARKIALPDLLPEIYWSADESHTRFTAVLDPLAWADHRIAYEPIYSMDWQWWKGGDGKKMPQVDFARFIEDNAPCIVEPSSADMIEISRSMEAKKKVRFASAIRLSDGQTQFAYEEDIQGTVLKGIMAIPEMFKIGIPVFVGGDRYAVDCRLRYRLDDGRLSMWYEMVRPHLVIEDAVKTMCEAVAAGTACKMYRGNLPARS